MEKEKMARAFNEWMRRYVETPETFANEWQSLKQYLAESKDGQTPTYGETSAAYLIQLSAELEVQAF
jgi:hypothetical protein